MFKRKVSLPSIIFQGLFVCFLGSMFFLLICGIPPTRDGLFHLETQDLSLKNPDFHHPDLSGFVFLQLIIQEGELLVIPWNETTSHRSLRSKYIYLYHLQGK